MNLWSHFGSLAQGFSDHHFERGEGPGDEVVFFHLHSLYIRIVNNSRKGICYNNHPDDEDKLRDRFELKLHFAPVNVHRNIASF